MKKILFTDLDGTLLNNQSKISEPMKEALDKMIQAGHVLVLSSGRPLHSIISIKENAGIDYPGIYIIANNGGLVYDCDKKENILERRVSYEDMMTTWNLAKEHGLHIQTYSESHIISSNTTKALEYYTRKVTLPVIFSDNPAEVLDAPPYKLLAINLDSKEPLDQFAADLATKETNLTTLFSNPKFLEVIPADSGKGKGLLWLCDYLGIPVANSIASGDAENDLSMLQAAGMGVAMANAEELLREHADVVTEKSNDENGLVEIIEKYILK